MVDRTGVQVTGSPPETPQVSSAVLANWRATLGEAVVGDSGTRAGMARAPSSAEAIEQIAELERLKAVCAARQAELTAAFAASQRAEQAAAGLCKSKRGRGLALQIGLARRDSPNKGGRHLGFAEALVNDMPHTLAALRRGDTSEWRATLMVRETACLCREDRRAVDELVGPHLADYGDKRTCDEARAHAYRLDPAAALERTRKAEADRCVSLRPAPDTMTYLTGLLPVKQGVAALAALSRHADRRRASGDERSRGQIMADELVARVTGATSADATDAEVVVVVSGDALFAPPTDERSADRDATATGGASASATDVDASGRSEHRFDPGEEPGVVLGFGSVPASWVRRLAREQKGRVWLRRAFARPADGSLIAMESRRRLFPPGLRRALIVRDQTCRTPWCDAPIRHADHVRPHDQDGSTSFDNGDGLCEACNLAKEAPGLMVRPVPPDEAGCSGVVEITTPTGHTYLSYPRQLPGVRRPERGASAHEFGPLRRAG